MKFTMGPSMPPCCQPAWSSTGNKSALNRLRGWPQRPESLHRLERANWIKSSTGQLNSTRRSQYLHGSGNIIPGLEAELEGKTAGKSIEVRVEPADGYGEKRDEMVQTIPREHMPDGVELEVGMQLQAQTPEGEAQLVTIVGLTNTDVTLDGNHPLAGVALNFAVEVVEVRQATEEELSHGHVHGPGGHEH